MLSIRNQTLALLLTLCWVFAVPAAKRSDEDYFRGQPNYISVIVATHNDGRHITSVLESVEESVELFLRTRKANQQSSVAVQIIIVDDNSDDATALKAHRFIKHRKTAFQVEHKKIEEGLWVNRSDHVPYPASQFLMKETRYLMLELHTTSRVGLGTAYNLGASYTLGEILFFVDGRGFISKSHIVDCYNALVSSKNAYGRAGISFTKDEEAALRHGIPASQPISHNLEQVEEELKQESAVLPLNLCVWRKVHHFIEGFPESSVWDDSTEKLGEAYLNGLNIGFPWSPVPSPAVELLTIKKDISVKYENEKEVVRNRILDAHVQHLRAKLLIYKKGGEPEDLNPAWRIQANALKLTSIPFTMIHKLETRIPRLRSVTSLAERLFKAGDTLGTAAAYNITSELLFDKKYVNPAITSR